MKFVLIFLCFIVVGLAAVPCCACEEEISDVKAAEKKIPSGNNQQQDDCCKDCSPFYVCGNCTGFLISTQVLSINPCLAVKKATKNGIYLEKKLAKIDLTIWQPPQ